MNSSRTIRPLTPGDLTAFRDLRLEAVRNHPDFFGADFDDENAAPQTYFQQLLETSHWFGILENQNLIGIAALRIHALRQIRHHAGLWGMYLKPELYGTGVADEFMLHILRAAKDQAVEQVELRVMEPNERAHRFYKKHGFKEIGRTPRVAKLRDGRYINDSTLLRILSE